MAFNWYLSLPGDSDIVSQHPSNERSFRATVNGAFGIEHDTVEGRHKFGVGDTTDRDALNGTWADGSVWIDTTDGRSVFQRAVSVTGGTPSSWADVGEFAGGGTVKLAFAMAAAPVGWTQTSDNDRLLRVVSGAGGGTGGAWAISGLSVESANHTHNIVGTTGNESNTHTHGVSGTTSGPSATLGDDSGAGARFYAHPTHTHTLSVTSGNASATHTHSISFASAGVSADHTHTGDGSWRPAYIDMIIASKD
jgi:hypothetical protein